MYLGKKLSKVPDLNKYDKNCEVCHRNECFSPVLAHCLKWFILQIFNAPEEETFVLCSEHHPALCDVEHTAANGVSGASLCWRESVTRCHRAPFFHGVSVDGFR